MRIKTTLLAACAAALIAPAASQAATLGMEGDTLVYRGEGAEGISLLLSSYDDWDTGKTFLRFSDSGADRIQINTGVCQNHQYGGIICERDLNRPIRIEGSSAKDDISIYSTEAVPDSIPVSINGNDGDDRIKDAYDSSAGRVLTGGGGNDEIDGYAGNDTLDGGDGNDKLDGGEGNDRVLGGNGDDAVDGDGYEDPGSDVIDGGAGYDYFEGWSQPEDLQRQPTVTLTLDGAANDGRPGENDNVTDVEDFQMYVVGSFTGSDGPEKFVIYNPGNTGPSNLIGRGGDDELVGHDFNDNVDGGAGNDHVEGGLGNDTVTGGPGQDTIYGDATAVALHLLLLQDPLRQRRHQRPRRRGRQRRLRHRPGQGDRRRDRRRDQLRDGRGRRLQRRAALRRRTPGQRPEVHLRARPGWPSSRPRA